MLVCATNHLHRHIADPSVDTEFSGTTAVVGTVRNRTLAVANIGDSRCILGRASPSVARMPRRASLGTPALALPDISAGSLGRNSASSWKIASAGIASGTSGTTMAIARAGGLVAVEVTSDHKPDRPDEERRILERGGRVFAVEYEDGIDGPQRVWLGHMDIPGLAMSRSLCDSVAHTAGVISTAEITIIELGPADKVIVWASDGLWEFMTNQEVGITRMTRSESCSRLAELLYIVFYAHRLIFFTLYRLLILLQVSMIHERLLIPLLQPPMRGG